MQGLAYSCCVRRGVPFVICAPSGAGKTTLIRRLCAEFPNSGFSVSCTTRKPRADERDGIDYSFVQEAEFRERIATGFFAEWARVHGNFYGTPLAPVQARLAAGQDILFDVDVQGAAQLRLSLGHGFYVFLFPPSLEELERRLRARGSDDESSIQQRLQVARQEMREFHWFDALIINDDLERAYGELRAVYTAATLSPSCQSARANTILFNREGL